MGLPLTHGVLRAFQTFTGRQTKVVVKYKPGATINLKVYHDEAPLYTPWVVGIDDRK